MNLCLQRKQWERSALNSACGKWEKTAPSLQLAAANVAAEGMQDRISLRRQSVTAIDDEAAFDLIWMPSPFLTREVVDCALPRVVRALAPGGFLVFGIFASRPDPLNQALTDLLTIRSGGHPWRSEEVEERLPHSACVTSNMRGLMRLGRSLSVGASDRQSYVRCWPPSGGWAMFVIRPLRHDQDPKETFGSARPVSALVVLRYDNLRKSPGFLRRVQLVLLPI